MGGDAKSPQHTVVHPMYVSYSCLPTATISSPKHGTTTTLSNPTATTNNNIHKLSFGHNNNHNINDNNNDSKLAKALNNTNSSMSSLLLTNTNNNHQYPHLNQHRRRLSNTSNKQTNVPHNNNNNYRPDIRYTELSTEQLVQNLSAVHSADHNFQNYGYIPQPRPHRPIVHHSNIPVDYDYDDDNDDSDPQTPPPPPPPRFFAQTPGNSFYHHHHHQTPTRSPILNRSGSSGQRRQFNHFVDQIRDAPPGYVSVSTNNTSSSIQRAKSQDRLGQRRQSQQQRGRPRSYCSNNGGYPAENL